MKILNSQLQPSAVIFKKRHWKQHGDDNEFILVCTKFNSIARVQEQHGCELIEDLGAKLDARGYPHYLALMRYPITVVSEGKRMKVLNSKLQPSDVQFKKIYWKRSDDPNEFILVCTELKSVHRVQEFYRCELVEDLGVKRDARGYAHYLARMRYPKHTHADDVVSDKPTPPKYCFAPHYKPWAGYAGMMMNWPKMVYPTECRYGTHGAPYWMTDSVDRLIHKANNGNRYHTAHYVPAPILRLLLHHPLTLALMYRNLLDARRSNMHLYSTIMEQNINVPQLQRMLTIMHDVLAVLRIGHEIPDGFKLTDKQSQAAHSAKYHRLQCLHNGQPLVNLKEELYPVGNRNKTLVQHESRQRESEAGLNRVAKGLEPRSSQRIVGVANVSYPDRPKWLVQSGLLDIDAKMRNPNMPEYDDSAEVGTFQWRMRFFNYSGTYGNQDELGRCPYEEAVEQVKYRTQLEIWWLTAHTPDWLKFRWYCGQLMRWVCKELIKNYSAVTIALDNPEHKMHEAVDWHRNMSWREAGIYNGIIPSINQDD